MAHHWSRILCAVDFSETSRTTLMQAAVLAARGGSELVILHVYEKSLRGSGDILSTDPELEDQRVQHVNQVLDTLRQDAEAILHGHVSAESTSGEPATEIVNFAERGNFDVIVMGTHGTTGLRRLLLGSVTYAVARRAPCSVLIVREPMFRIEPD